MTTGLVVGIFSPSAFARTADSGLCSCKLCAAAGMRPLAVDPKPRCKQAERNSPHKTGDNRPERHPQRKRSGLKLSNGGLKGVGAYLLQWPWPNFFGQNFNSPRASVAKLFENLHEALHIELAFATKPSMIHGIFMQTPRRLKCSVVEFDTDEIFRREPSQLFEGYAHFCEVPYIETNSAILGAGASYHRQRILERIDHGKRHDLEADLHAVLGSISAKYCETLDDLRHGVFLVIEISHLHVMGMKRFGCIQQLVFLKVR